MGKRSYSINELVLNPSFRRMVQGTASTEEIEYWSRWMEFSDENRETAKKAVSRLAGFELADPFEVSELDSAKEWSRLYDSTIGKPDLNLLPFFTKKAKYFWLYRLVAVFLFASIIGSGIWFYLQNAQQDKPTEQIAIRKAVFTKKGQQKTLIFTNGAKIVMNSNSVLTYSTGNKSGQTIQVYLKQGGAYFSDKHLLKVGTGKRNTFNVTTPDGLVKDIGTEFVVSVNKNGSRVILQDGHVRIETNKPGKPGQGYDMKKGEMVTLRKALILKKEYVNPTFYSAWATGFIQFYHTPVHKFARYIEKRFEVKVVIVDPSLTKVTLDGAVYFRSLEGLVRSVSAATQVPVYLSGNRGTVYIGNPNNSKNVIKQ